MARRTKRPKVVWLPNTNAFSIDAATTNTSVYGTVQHDLTAQNAGEFIISTQSVVIDGDGLDPLGADTTLADVESSSYRLRRIVGKVWCGYLQEAANTPPSVICTAGFIILRTDNSGVPIGLQGNYYPGDIRQSMDPWIWRRSWLLSNTLATNVNFFQSALGCNTINGSVSDGPHVDQKTARIVGPEERLFLVLSTTAAVPGGDQAAGNIRYFWDLRVLASMRSNAGNRRNASR